MPYIDPWAGFNQGLQAIGSAVDDVRNQQRTQVTDARNAEMQGLQMQASRATLADLAAKRGALIQQHAPGGTLAEAYANQAKAEKAAEQRKIQSEQVKFAFDSLERTHKAVMDGVLSEEEATALYDYGMKINGHDLKAKGVNISFKKDGGYFSGPVDENTLFMVNGKPTPYGAKGVIEKAKIVGIDPETQKPVYSMSETTTFKEHTKSAETYKDRTRTVGDKTVFEESQDGGKTWKKVSEGPRYKPASEGGNTPVAQSTFVDPVSGKPLVFDKKTGSYRVATVEGGVAPKPAAMSPEAAGKAQMIEQGLTYIPTLRSELFDKDGSVNRTNVANLTARTWGTRGRELSTLLLDAVEAKLRAESGAAVPEPEVRRAAKRFIPSVGDTANNVKIKLDNLETYLKGTKEKINTGRDKNNGGGDKSGGGSYSDLLNKYRK